MAPKKDLYSVHDLDASLRREQGDVVADAIARYIRGEVGSDPVRRRPVPRKVGKKGVEGLAGGGSTGRTAPSTLGRDARDPQ